MKVLEGKQLELILAAGGPEAVDAWVQTSLASHPQDEKIILKRAFRALNRDHPAESVVYGERLLLKNAPDYLLKSMAATYVKIGSLDRAFELARRMKHPDGTWIAKLRSRYQLLKNGFPLPERAAGPPFSPVLRRVMYVLHNSQPHGSAGYAIRSQGLAKAIRQHGYELYGVTRLGYPWDTADFDPSTVVDIVEQVDGVPYVRLPSTLVGYRSTPLEEYLMRCADRLCALAEILKPSIIHAASNYICGAAANLAARRLGLPCVYEVRGLWEVTTISRRPELRETDLHRMFERMETETACNASAVLAITGGVKQELVRRGVPQDKITLLPNGVDICKWQPIARDVELERSLGFKRRVVIGYIGSTSTYEGLDLLLHAAQRLRERSRSRFSVLIVGDGDALADLQALAGELQLGDTVIFTGRVPHAEVGRYYSLIDIAAYPRKGLTVCEMVSPLKPLETMAMGKPVICSDVAALSEIVSHEKTGLLHSKDDVESLVSCIERLLDSAELRARLGSAARDWVRANRDWRALAATACETYNALTSELHRGSWTDDAGSKRSTPA